MYIKSLYPNQNQYELWLYYLKSVLQAMLAEYLHFEPPLLCEALQCKAKLCKALPCFGLVRFG